MQRIPLNVHEIPPLLSVAAKCQSKGNFSRSSTLFLVCFNETFDAEYLFSAALCSRLSKNFERSIELFQVLLSDGVHPQHFYLEAGLTYLEIGDFERAFIVFSKAYVIKPDPLSALWVGISLRRQNRFDEALHWVHKTLQDQPESYPALLEAAQNHEGRLDYKAASKFYRSALNVAPADGFSFTFDRLGICLIKTKQLSATRDMLEDRKYLDTLQFSYGYCHAILWSLQAGVKPPSEHLLSLALNKLLDSDEHEVIDVTTLAYAADSSVPESIGWCSEILQKTEYGRDALEIVRDFTLDRITELLGKQEFTTASDTINVIARFIRSGEPFSIVRLGDGEGNFLGTVLGIDNKFLAAQSDRILDIWFGSDRLPSTEYAGLVKRLSWAIETADVVGIPDKARLNYELSNDPRGYWGVYFSTFYGLSHIQNQICTTPNLHLNLFGDHRFLSALMSVKRLDTISCHSQLGPRLRAHFGVNSGVDLTVPGEMAMDSLPNEARQGLHFPSYYNETLEAIRLIPKGTVVLVAAGLLGKIYSAEIKLVGGIAIDIGAVADYLMGFRTREIFSRPDFLPSFPPLLGA